MFIYHLLEIKMWNKKIIIRNESRLYNETISRSDIYISFGPASLVLVN